MLFTGNKKFHEHTKIYNIFFLKIQCDGSPCKLYIYIRWFCEPTLPSGTPRAGMGSRLSGQSFVRSVLMAGRTVSWHRPTDLFVKHGPPGAPNSDPTRRFVLPLLSSSSVPCRIYMNFWRVPFGWAAQPSGIAALILSIDRRKFQLFCSARSQPLYLGK